MVILGNTRLTPRVIGPHENVIAIVINRNRGAGFVKIVHQGQEIEVFPTSSSEDEAIMVFLKPGYFCVLVGNAHAKYIKK